jgi:hypothetical protein
MTKSHSHHHTTDQISVKLVAPHVHEGQQLNAGDNILVSPDRADWMRRQGIIDSPKTEDSDNLDNNLTTGE